MFYIHPQVAPPGMVADLGRQCICPALAPCKRPLGKDPGPGRTHRSPRAPPGRTAADPNPRRCQPPRAASPPVHAPPPTVGAARGRSQAKGPRPWDHPPPHRRRPTIRPRGNPFEHHISHLEFPCRLAAWVRCKVLQSASGGGRSVASMETLGRFGAACEEGVAPGRYAHRAATRGVEREAAPSAPVRPPNVHHCKTLHRTPEARDYLSRRELRWTATWRHTSHRK
jgi:hypothetical protein